MGMTPARIAARRSTGVAIAALLALGLMLAGGLTSVDPATAGATDRLPDLSLKRPELMSIQTTASGVRRLRFSTSIVNIGAGPFETRASRSSTSVAKMNVRQVIYLQGGGTRDHTTNAFATYAGDGHDHWHVEEIARYDLFRVTPGGSLARDNKVGFCFFDTNPYNLSLPNAPSSRQYFQSSCGTTASLSTRNGISVGWSDIYPANFAFQWITITGIPAGEYYLKMTVNPNGYFLETVKGNNCTWARIRIPATGSTVTQLSSGWGCTLPGAGPTPIPTGRAVVPPRPPSGG
jgi:hypothetical protein